VAGRSTTAEQIMNSLRQSQLADWAVQKVAKAVSYRGNHRGRG